MGLLQLRRDLQHLFSYLGLVASGSFGERVPSSVSPNAFDLLAPLPPCVDILNQALAVTNEALTEAALCAAGSSNLCSCVEETALRGQGLAQAASALAPERIFQEDCGSLLPSSVLLFELYRHQEHRGGRPSLSVPSSLIEASKQIAQRQGSLQVSGAESPAASRTVDAAESASLFALSALASHCADVRRREPRKKPRHRKVK